MIEFAVRHWITNHEAGIDEPKPGNTVGTVFYGSNGYLSVWDEDHSKYHSFIGREQTPGPSGGERANHWANFIEAVRSRKQSDLNGADRGRRDLDGADAPGEHLVPARAVVAIRRRDVLAAWAMRRRITCSGGCTARASKFRRKSESGRASLQIKTPRALTLRGCVDILPAFGEEVDDAFDVSPDGDSFGPFRSGRARPLHRRHAPA